MDYNSLTIVGVSVQKKKKKAEHVKLKHIQLWCAINIDYI